MTLVSVIIPAYNAAPFLRQAIDSVQAQDHPDVEIVVVNDGSTDDTAAIMASFGPAILSVHQENRGLPAARNSGVAVASGAYLAFLDADDWITADKLSRQSSYLDGHLDIGLVASGLEIVDDAGQHIRWLKPWLHAPVIDLELLTFVGLVGVHGVLLRRTWLDRVAGFDETLDYGEDMDLWWRLMAEGCQMAWLPGIVGSYRVHQASMSQKYLRHHDKLVALLDRQLKSGLLAPTALDRRPNVVARMKLALAGRLFGSGDSAAASRVVIDALQLDPTLRDPASIVHAIASWRNDPWVQGRNEIVGQALAELSPPLAWIKELKPQIEISYWQQEFYTAAIERDRHGVAKSWLSLVRCNRRWLSNRGGWSILWSSWQWPKADAGHGA